MAEYPQNPDLQYYPPPRAWLSPPASWVETPPTWIDPPSSSSSDHVPLWVILGLVAAILILLLFIFMYIKKRFKSNSHCRASPAVEKTVAALPPPPVVEKIVAAPPQHGHHHNCEGHLAAGMPKDCPSCGRSAGLYQLTYRCPKCIYKQDIGIHIDYPNKK